MSDYPHLADALADVPSQAFTRTEEPCTAPNYSVMSPLAQSLQPYDIRDERAGYTASGLFTNVTDDDLIQAAQEYDFVDLGISPREAGCRDYAVRRGYGSWEPGVLADAFSLEWSDEEREGYSEMVDVRAIEPEPVAGFRKPDTVALVMPSEGPSKNKVLALFGNDMSDADLKLEVIGTDGFTFEIETPNYAERRRVVDAEDDAPDRPEQATGGDQPNGLVCPPVVSTERLRELLAGTTDEEDRAILRMAMGRVRDRMTLDLACGKVSSTLDTLRARYPDDCQTPESRAFRLAVDELLAFAVGHPVPAPTQPAEAGE